MITKAELEKMVEDESVNIFKSVVNPFKRLDMETSFESGASFVTGILMPEIEMLKDNALKENEVIIRLTRERDEFMDRMIKAEIALGKQATLWEKELSEANARIDKMMNAHLDSSKEWSGIVDERDATIQSLKDENNKFREAFSEINRFNGDCSKVEIIILKTLTQKAEE